MRQLGEKRRFAASEDHVRHADLGQPVQHAALGHVVAHFDSAGEPERIGAAVALDGNAVEAEKRPAVEPARVHPLLEALQAPHGEHCPDLGEQRAG